MTAPLFADGFKEDPWWWEHAPLRSIRSAAAPGDDDVVVIGSGYAGLNAAITLADAGIGVTLLEAGRFGEGASTRNGGQLLAEARPSPQRLETRHGAATARAILDDFAAAPDFLRERLAGFRIECHAEWNGLFIGAHSRRAFRKMLPGPGVRIVPEADIGTEIRTALYRGGAVLAGGGQIHPALYHAGLLAAAEANGAKLHAGIPALGVRQRPGGGVDIDIPGGSIRARRAIVATNGYTSAAMPWLRRRLIPIRSYMIATEQMPETDIRALLPGDRAVADTKGVLYYFRASPDRRRILFGGRASFRDTDARTAAATLRRFLAHVFPGLAGVRVTHAWFGNVAFSFDLLPHAAWRGDVCYVGGCCGSGVVMMSWLGHKAARGVIEGPAAMTGLSAIAPPAPPLYTGRPWFVPPIGMALRMKDRIDRLTDR